jgi:formylglycine-generating enzyme required for sulfatase activity
VNWLNPLGADPKPLAAELARLDSDRSGTGFQPVSDRSHRQDARASSAMDAILFDPDTSTRRALILALGTYASEGLSPAERQPLIARLLDLYDHDPDAGIHGAAEWTLRQWKQAEKLAEIDKKLRGKAPGDRRWFVNGQGQTFALIKGPLKFRMGSPPNEADRDADEIPHDRAISGNFAIAVKEVTVEGYQSFMRENLPAHVVAIDRYSPDPQGPMNGPSWYDAAAYCNWMSKRDGIPEDQWCYLQNERKEYDKGMTIPADVLKRKGYRLPTEAEWEYACRAGALTSRYYGSSIDLLGAYARYQGSSQDHAWKCGSLLANDLGLFDMLGNVYEWCQERHTSYQPGRTESVAVDIVDDVPRLIRGGAFSYLPANVRSAYRDGLTPAYRYFLSGFRLARTYN